MRKILLLGTAMVFTLPFASAKADLILVGGNPPVGVSTPAESFTDLGAQGFGNAPRLLTMQTSGIETGNVTPVDTVNGAAISGANKSTTPTLSALGWNFGSRSESASTATRLAPASPCRA